MLIEAADAFGMTSHQKLFACNTAGVPIIMAGVNQTIMMKPRDGRDRLAVSAPGLGVLVLPAVFAVLENWGVVCFSGFGCTACDHP